MFEFGGSLPRRSVFPARASLVRANEQQEHCYILLDGIVVREKQLYRGNRQVVGLHVPGDVCGLSVLSDTRADYDMVALSPVSCVCVTRQWLSSSARGAIEVLEAVWREMSREAVISAAWTVNVGQRSAYARLAHLMCEIDARLHAGGQDTSAGFDWPGTQADIGAAAGLSLVHVNKTLRRLEVDRLVSCGRRITLHDPARLAAVAGFDPGYLALDGVRLGEILRSRIKFDPAQTSCPPNGSPAGATTTRLPMTG